MSVQIKTSGGALIDMADVSGQFNLGAGDTIIGVLLETVDNQGNWITDIRLACTLQNTITPTFAVLRGAV